MTPALVRLRTTLRDARIFQVVFQSSLLLTGLLLLPNFVVAPAQVFLTLAAAAAVQWGFARALRLKNAGVLSPLITALGVCLFLRADNFWIHPLASAAAVASKFLIRFRGKHIFNPSNFGVVVALLLLPGAWVTPGQWGYGVLTAAWCVALGSTVVYRAQRNDISWAFLVLYLGILAVRTAWLGLSWSAFYFQINGGLLIFSFFMISDPMATPNHARGRVVFAALVASLAYLLQYTFYPSVAQLWIRGETRGWTNAALAYKFHAQGLLLALFAASPLVPLMDKLWPAPKHDWNPKTA
jgi:enediyne biosynthesis protein E5